MVFNYSLLEQIEHQKENGREKSTAEYEIRESFVHDVFSCYFL